MSDPEAIVRLYFAPLSFPCGPQSSCCGSTGQSDDEIAAWKQSIERNIAGARVDPINVGKPLRRGRDDAVLRLLRTFGIQACPIFALGQEVLSMGPPSTDELLALLCAKIAARTEA